MSKFLETYGKDPIVMETMDPVKEGVGFNQWMYALTAWNYIGLGAHKLYFNSATIKKLSQDKKFQNYIKTKANEIIKEVKKTDRTVSTDVDEWDIGDIGGRLWANFKQNWSTPIPDFRLSFNARWQTKIGKYLITFYGVGSELDSIYLWFRSEIDGLFYVEIPAPGYETRNKF